MEAENNSVMIWQNGAPQNKLFTEWFIAKLDNGQKVVLKRLSDENSYDFTTADETYYKEFRIAKWMNFPESEYYSPIAMQLLEALENITYAFEVLCNNTDENPEANKNYLKAIAAIKAAKGE